jgi:predicted metal-dependent hydrolase
MSQEKVESVRRAHDAFNRAAFGNEAEALEAAGLRD